MSCEGSGSLRARVEHLAVQVHVELDRGESVGRRVDLAAEGGELAFVPALLAGAADELVLLVLRLPDPLARRLPRSLVGGEHVPSARRAASKFRAGDPVLPATELPGGEALV